MDTIHITLHSQDCAGMNFLKEVGPRFPDPREYKHIRSDRTTRYGKYGNLELAVTENEFKISNSWAVEAHGHNMMPLTMEEFRDKVLEIGEVYGVPLGRAKVMRVDYPVNIFLDHPVETYNPTLGKLGKMTRMLIKNSLYYKSDRYELVLYDKIKEVKSKYPILPEWEGKNVGRLEIKLWKNISDATNGAIQRAEDLWSPTGYYYLPQRLLSTFEAIEKEGDAEIDYEKLTGWKSYSDYLAYVGCQSLGGRGKSKEQIAFMVRNGIIKNSSTGSRMKKQLDKLYRIGESFETNAKAVELLTKIKAACQVPEAYRINI